MRYLTSFSVGLVAAGLMLATMAEAAPVNLQNGTATFSQPNGDFFGINDVSTTFGGGRTDDSSAEGNEPGWAISNAGQTESQVAVWETAANQGSAGGITNWTFSLLSGGFGDHTLGALRILHTTSDRIAFADGSNNAGNVGAPGIWTAFDLSASDADSDNPNTMIAELAGEILRFSGPTNNLERYTITATTTGIAGVTGLRLEVLDNIMNLPTGGPGRANNGNFVLREFSVQADTTQPPPVSAPSTAALFLVAPLAAWMGRRRRAGR